MPKGGKKGNKKNSASFTTDVTLEDYANSSVSAARLRKPATNSLVREVKSLCSTEKSWYERDIEEFEIFGENEDDDDVTLSAIQKRKSLGTKSHRSKNDSSCLNSSVGLHYPIDLWYLIGEYIKPEDVSTFAALCKASHHVTRTYKFWMDMYKRMFTSVAVLLVSSLLAISCAPVSRKQLPRHHSLRCTHVDNLTKRHLPPLNLAKVILPLPKHQVLPNSEKYNENEEIPFLTPSLHEATNFHSAEQLPHQKIQNPSWYLLRNPAIAFAPTATHYGDDDEYGNQRSFPEIDAKGFNEDIFHEEFGAWYPMRW